MQKPLKPCRPCLELPRPKHIAVVCSTMLSRESPHSMSWLSACRRMERWCLDPFPAGRSFSSSRCRSLGECLTRTSGRCTDLSTTLSPQEDSFATSFRDSRFGKALRRSGNPSSHPAPGDCSAKCLRLQLDRLPIEVAPPDLSARAFRYGAPRSSTIMHGWKKYSWVKSPNLTPCIYSAGSLLHCELSCRVVSFHAGSASPHQRYLSPHVQRDQLVLGGEGTCVYFCGNVHIVTERGTAARTSICKAGYVGDVSTSAWQPR